LGGGGGTDGRAGDRYNGSPFGGATRGDGREFTPEEIRQYRAEFGQREAQARDLAEVLAEAGRSTDEVDDVIEAFDRLQDEEVYADPEALAAIHEDMIDRLKRLEFSLRRDVEGEVELRGSLTGADEVPEGYRELVEEYYRALARGGSPPGGR
ncbi:MAG: hypothetical protein HKO77_07295, partial [Gemmatimonadetes bacterium]|nr:hypothetical protein [Gemmatimonadota bacterium]NNL30811.1 hypothetical protein [Gemmatimonadota bacterium]